MLSFGRRVLQPQSASLVARRVSLADDRRSRINIFFAECLECPVRVNCCRTGTLTPLKIDYAATGAQQSAVIVQHGRNVLPTSSRPRMFKITTARCALSAAGRFSSAHAPGEKQASIGHEHRNTLTRQFFWRRRAPPARASGRTTTGSTCTLSDDLKMWMTK